MAKPKKHRLGGYEPYIIGDGIAVTIRKDRFGNFIGYVDEERNVIPHKILPDGTLQIDPIHELRVSSCLGISSLKFGRFVRRSRYDSFYNSFIGLMKKIGTIFIFSGKKADS